MPERAKAINLHKQNNNNSIKRARISLSGLLPNESVRFVGFGNSAKHQKNTLNPDCR